MREYEALAKARKGWPAWSSLLSGNFCVFLRLDCLVRATERVSEVDVLSDVAVVLSSWVRSKLTEASNAMFGSSSYTTAEADS